MKKTKRTLIIFISVIVVLAVAVTWGQINSKTSDPFEDDAANKILNKKIGYNEALTQSDDEYLVYFYKPECSDCNKVIDIVKENYSKHASFKVVNMSTAPDTRKKFDWSQFHTDNDIEIGKLDKNNKIVYNDGESEEKYTKSTDVNKYGKTIKYSIKTADEEYLKVNKNAKKGYVYASVETPEIDYTRVTSSDDLIIAGVPTLLKVKDGKVVEFYYDSYEVGPYLENN